METSLGVELCFYEGNVSGASFASVRASMSLVIARTKNGQNRDGPWPRHAQKHNDGLSLVGFGMLGPGSRVRHGGFEICFGMSSFGMSDSECRNVGFTLLNSGHDVFCIGTAFRFELGQA